MRLTRKRLLLKYAAEYDALRHSVELDLYPQVIEDWLLSHPETGSLVR